MADDKPGFFARIARFVKGNAERTPMHSEAMNQIVDLLNALLNSRGVNGIRVVPAMAGFTFELDDDAKKQLGRLPTVGPSGEVEPGLGTLKWRGEWDVTETDYVSNNIVKVSNSPAYIPDTDTAPVVGTWIANRVIVTGEVPGTSDGWTIFSRGAWQGVSFDSANGSIYMTADPTILGANPAKITLTKFGSPGITMSPSELLLGNTVAVSDQSVALYNSSSVQKIIMLVSDNGAAAADPSLNTVRVREVSFKDGAGVTKTAWFMCSFPS